MKFREQDHFDLFKQLYCQLRSYDEEKHEAGQKPEPDFLIAYPDKTLGIEHTEVYMDKERGQAVSPQQREGSFWKIVNDAKSICENCCVPPLEVKLWFSSEFENTKVKNKNAKRLSKQLAEFVAKEFRKGLSSYTCCYETVEKMPEISQISITPGDLDGKRWLAYHRWIKCAAGERQTEFIEELQESALSKKMTLDLAL